MEEIYEEIEARIRRAGYAGPVSGAEVYRELSDEIEGKENGTYAFLVKKEEGYYEYRVEVMDEQFNLSTLDIHEGGQVWHIDFDAD